ncbi:hypothetical protein RJ639_033633 [Escallonia herrerae]|uniref:Uncharacterized protein n=1 Tax=Escallonia herrerae TaxID=1293975 RepID=A0AA89BBR9_9ASTE|nr:hypothetical protein RJ639_033633 [Escallonia herrerae]
MVGTSFVGKGRSHSTVKVYCVIVNPIPPEPGENEEESVVKTRERLRWDQDDEICRGHILNGMSNTLFDAYHTVKTTKELWNQLERRYVTEDATSKRFIVSKFFDYKMVDGSKAYRFMVVEQNDYYSKNTIIESKDAIFDESRFQSLPKQVEQKESQRDVEKNYENEVEPRRSKRMRIAKTYGPDFYMYLIEGTRTTIYNSISVVLNVKSDPKTYEEAMKSQDSSFWKEPINEEIDSIMGNGTWKLVDLPPGSKPIDCKWIFKKKLRVDGSIENFKASNRITRGRVSSHVLRFDETTAHLQQYNIHVHYITREDRKEERLMKYSKSAKPNTTLKMINHDSCHWKQPIPVYFGTKGRMMMMMQGWKQDDFVATNCAFFLKTSRRLDYDLRAGRHRVLVPNSVAF